VRWGGVTLKPTHPLSYLAPYSFFWIDFLLYLLTISI